MQLPACHFYHPWKYIRERKMPHRKHCSNTLSYVTTINCKSEHLWKTGARLADHFYGGRYILQILCKFIEHGIHECLNVNRALQLFSETAAHLVMHLTINIHVTIFPVHSFMINLNDFSILPFSQIDLPLNFIIFFYLELRELFI